MSMPTLPPIDPELTKEVALYMVLQSIALEETALSRIIDAESEKIRAVVAYIEKTCPDADVRKLLEANRSVHDVLEQVKDIQMILKSKMSRALEYLPKPEPPSPEPKPPKPRPPCLCFCMPCCCPPPKDCVCDEPPLKSGRATSVFKVYRSEWGNRIALNLSKVAHVDDNLKLQRNRHWESVLSLSKNKYSIEFNIEFQKEKSRSEPIYLELKIHENETEIKNIVFTTKDSILEGGIIHTAHNPSRNYLVSISARSDRKIKIANGTVLVTKEPESRAAKK